MGRLIALVAAASIAVLDPAAAWPQADPAPQVGDSTERFHAQVDVRLQQIVVRVIDRRGEPIRGLSAEDFEARAGKLRLPIVAVDWVSSGSTAPPALSTQNEELIDPAGRGPSTLRGPGHRLVTFWVQAGLHPVRIKGHLKMLPLIEILLDALDPADLAAVVAFDSHLKLFQDFTSERNRILNAVEKAVRYDRPASVSSDTFSLAEYWDLRRARRSATPEDALIQTAEVLGRFPGEKEIILLGWGLGSRQSALKGRFLRAERALNRANTSVFVLDITDADYHDLEVGLRVMADRTGGTYGKTNRFSLRETKRLARALGGYYIVSVDVSDASAATLKITVPGIKGEVLYRSG